MVEENRTYAEGLRDGEMIGFRRDLEVLTHDVDALKKSVYMLYGAIVLLGFVVPLVQRWLG